VATKQFTAITDPDHMQRPRAGNFHSMRKRSDLPYTTTPDSNFVFDSVRQLWQV
jgi:hypothetical protein